MTKTLKDIISTISEIDGVQAAYGGGDYTVTVWDDMDGNYEMVFCRSNTDIAFDRQTVSAEDIEAKMSEYASRAEAWIAVEFGS